MEKGTLARKKQITEKQMEAEEGERAGRNVLSTYR